MATKTFEELKQLAIQIRDEKTNKQNTATRVGTAMLEHINKLEQDYYDKTQTDEELKERDDKLTELSADISNISSSTTLNNRLKELYIDKSKYNFSSARVKYVAYQSSSDTYPISIELYQNTISGTQKIIERAIPSSEFENNKVLEIADRKSVV